MAVVKHLFIDQNSNFEKTFTFYDQNRAPFDLTNYTAKAEIRKYTDYDVIATFSCEILSPPTLGKLVLSLDYGAVSDVKIGTYKYDILLTSVDDIKIRAVEGDVSIDGNITE